MTGTKQPEIPKFPPMKVLEQSPISPAPGSDAPATLPLTFFDYIFLPFDPVQRVFFYELFCSVPDFLQRHLPQLKLSLSLALRDFRPFAGTLQSNDETELVCSANDAVVLTVAESSDDFHDISWNRAKDCTRLYGLVPPLLETEKRRPVLALQVTVFPSAGVAIGITVSHAVADGSTSAHFLKTWAGLCRQGRGGSPPLCYDRSVVRDPKNLKRTFLRDLKQLKDSEGLEAWNLHGRDGVVRATFSFSQAQLIKLGKSFVEKMDVECAPSRYSLAVGLIWACLVKARGGTKGKKEYFGFVTGCRARVEPPLQASYFGNCLGLCRAEADGGSLAGEDGPLIASAAIWKVICELEKEGPFGDAENWVRDIYEKASAGILTVAGSPKLGLYQVDFGWGRPCKIEIISIERTSALSISEGAVDDRGLEIGLALPRDLMDTFSSLFASAIARLSHG